MVTFPQVNKPLKLTISDSAFLSWFKSSHRISVCQNCGRRARIRRNIAICGYCKARWPAGDIQDLIAELEANNAPVGLDASSRVTARAKEPSLSSVPGLTVSLDVENICKSCSYASRARS
jgi:hypothetical protein